MKIYTPQEIKALLDAVPNSPENAQIYAMLTQMYAESRVSREPYAFEVDFLAVTSGTTAAPGNFYVDSSSPFLLTKMNFMADVAAAGQTVATQVLPLMTVQITEASSNRNWQNAAVPVPSIFGTARQPGFLDVPRLIPANTTVQIIVANYDAAQTYNLRLSFIGSRLYA